MGERCLRKLFTCLSVTGETDANAVLASCGWGTDEAVCVFDGGWTRTRTRKREEAGRSVVADITRCTELSHYAIHPNYPNGAQGAAVTDHGMQRGEFGYYDLQPCTDVWAGKQD